MDCFGKALNVDMGGEVDGALPTTDKREKNHFVILAKARIP
jgi:hypothetical protein